MRWLAWVFMFVSVATMADEARIREAITSINPMIQQLYHCIYRPYAISGNRSCQPRCTGAVSPGVPADAGQLWQCTATAGRGDWRGRGPRPRPRPLRGCGPGARYSPQHPHGAGAVSP